MRLGLSLSPKLRLALEALVVVFVVAIAVHQAMRYLAQHYPDASFYQSRFTQAASFACGAGWKNFAVSEDERLGQFLAFRIPRIDCADLGSRPPIPSHNFEEQHRYLVGAVALWWRAHGRPDWQALESLFCVLFVLSVLSGYALLRLSAPALLAGAGAALFAASEAHLRNLIHLRDYGKAPFLLAGVAATLLIVYRWQARLPLLAAASGIAGLAAGVGVGFRQDLLLLVPFTLLSIVLFGGANPAGELRKKLVLVAIFLAAFAVTGTPVLTALQRGSNTSHVVLLGLGTPFDRPLGVRSAYYEVGDNYDDVFAHSLINAAHQARTGDATHLRLATESYESAGMSYLRTLVALAPGDFATRATGAIAAVLSYDYGLRMRNHVAGMLLMACLIVLAAQALRRERGLREMICPAFVMLYFTGTAFLQFQERHIFHLAIVQVAILTWGAEAVRREALALVSSVRSGAPLRAAAWRAGGAALARNAIILGLIFSAACAGLFILRHAQSREIRAFFERTADPSAYTALAHADANGVRRYSLEPDGAEGRERWLRYDYLMARFDASKCSYPHVHFAARYAAKSAVHDLTKSYRLAIDADTRFLLPVFRSHEFRFLGVEVPADQASCVSFVGKRADKRLDFLLIARLETDWKDRAAYQTLWLEPRPDVQRRPDDHLEPRDARVAEQRAWQQLEKMEILRAEGRAYVSSAAAPSDAGLTLHRRFRPEYLVKNHAVGASPGCRLAIVAEGEIVRGGLTIGALTADEKAWDTLIQIKTPGWFRALVLAKGDRAVPLIENLPLGLRGTAATLYRLGAAELCP